MDSLRWSLHLEECLAILEREQEWAQDKTLTTMVRLQLIADEAHKLLQQDIMKGENTPTPSFVHHKALMNRLQDIREGMSPSVETHRKSTH